MKKIVLAISISIIGIYNVFSQNSFELGIERKLSTASCTMGYLLINGNAICHTLELPWNDNLNNISCIPVGTYPGILRYDKTDGWRIQLENVPNRTGVQIHIGNYTTEIKGCILVGMDAKTETCAVYKSTEAYNKIKEAFYGSNSPNSTPNKSISLTIK